MTPHEVLLQALNKYKGRGNETITIDYLIQIITEAIELEWDKDMKEIRRENTDIEDEHY